MKAMHAIATVLATTAAFVGTAAAQTYDVKKPAWFAARTVCTYAQLPGFAGGSGPNAPTPERRDVVTYLIGPINTAHPYGPQVTLPFGTVPAHDDTFSEYITAGAPADAFGAWVVAGPNASPLTVHTRPAPAGSLAGAPLAYEIKVGTRFVALTERSIVEYGLQLGLIALVDAGWGGVSWLSEGCTN